MDNPILRDLCLSIVGALDHNIACRIIRADDLKHEVGAIPEACPLARVLCIGQEQEIWLAVLARSDLDPQWREEHNTAHRLEKREETEIEQRKDLLMLRGWHWQHLHNTVGKLDQPPARVR